MLARRIALLAALLLFTAVLTSSVSSRRDTGEQAVAPAPGAPATPAEEVTGTLPEDRTVRARVGDVISVEVRPATADRVVVEQLGISADADPQIPGRLQFVAPEPGRYAVTLESSGDRLGTILVQDGDGSGSP